MTTTRIPKARPGLWPSERTVDGGVYMVPRAETVAKVVAESGFSAAASRWHFMTARELQDLADAGRPVVEGSAHRSDAVTVLIGIEARDLRRRLATLLTQARDASGDVQVASVLSDVERAMGVQTRAWIADLEKVLGGRT